MCISGPDSGYKITSVLSLTEIILLDAFLVHIISLFDFYACINDRNKPDMILLQVLYVLREITELLIYRKIFIVIHIVNIHINHIYRNMIFPVFFCHRNKILRRFISPAALPEAKREFRCNIASANHLPKLLCNIVWIFACDNIQIKICPVTEDMKLVRSCVTDIKGEC